MRKFKVGAHLGKGASSSKPSDSCVFGQCRTRAAFTYGHGFSYCEGHIHGKGELLKIDREPERIPPK